LKYYSVMNTALFKGYDDQPVLIIDNLNSDWIKEHELLEIMDGHYKGHGNTSMSIIIHITIIGKWTHVFITSLHTTEKVYGHKGATNIKRKLKAIIHFSKPYKRVRSKPVYIYM